MGVVSVSGTIISHYMRSAKRICPTLTIEAVVGMVSLYIFVRTPVTLFARRMGIEANVPLCQGILYTVVNSDLISGPTDRRAHRKFNVFISIISD